MEISGCILSVFMILLVISFFQNGFMFLVLHSHLKGNTMHGSVLCFNIVFPVCVSSDLLYSTWMGMNLHMNLDEFVITFLLIVMNKD